MINIILNNDYNIIFNNFFLFQTSISIHLNCRNVNIHNLEYREEIKLYFIIY